MFVMARELIGALKAARLFVSVDETRTNINSLHVEATGGALRLVATDGHTLFACEVPARDAASDPPPAYQAAWNVSLEDVDRIIGLLKDRHEVELELAKRTVAGATFAQHSETFAPYAHVVPVLASTVPGKVLPEFAATYIARCCEAFGHYAKGFAPSVPKTGSKHEKKIAQIAREAFMCPPIAWRIGGEYDPAVFYSPKFPAAFAVVMPRKGAGNNSVSVEGFLERTRTSGSKKAA